jgi:hypothetical protein
MGLRGNAMVKFIENVLFGLAFGIGFAIATNVLALIAALLSGGHMPVAHY